MRKKSGVPKKRSTKMPDVPANPAVEVLSNTSKVRMLSPSLVLLEIPMDTCNTDLPVWDAVRSQQVDVAWTVSAYSIAVVITPVPATVAQNVAKRKRDGGLRNDSTPSGASETPSPTKQLRISIQHVPLTQSASNVLLTVLPSSHVACSPVNPFAPTPVTSNSFFCPLPLIISQTPRPAAASSTRPSYPAKKAPKCSNYPAKKAPIPSSPPLTRAATSKKSSSAPAGSPAAIEKFHTRLSSDIQICDEFLLNLCDKGESCEMHHTPYPFHWQLFTEGACQWVDLNPAAQLWLERHYCNVNVDEIEIKNGFRRLRLNLGLMKVNFISNDSMMSPKVGLKYSCAVRRLSNTSDPTRNPHFPTKWRIYRSITGIWEEYPKEVSKLLLEKMADREPECTVQINGQTYKVNFDKMTQTRDSNPPGPTARICCRPTYRSPASMEPHLHKRTGTPGEPPEANFNVDPLKAFASWYPPVWSLVPHQDYRLVDVPTGTQAFLKVQNLFHQSLPETEMEITSIQQIQNLLHWDKFQRHKAYMEQKSIAAKSLPLERHAFHGTDSEAVPQICRNNFDPRVSGTHGVAFGHGSYFARNASYCHQYSHHQDRGGVRHMFLAKVLVGSTVQGNSTYRRPPAHKSSPLLFYDTCVDYVAQPSIFVVFDSCQCYPYYLIKYKELSRVIDISK